MPYVQLVSDVPYEFPVYVETDEATGPKFREAAIGDDAENIISFQMRYLKHNETSAIDDATMVTKGTKTHYLVGHAREAKMKKCVTGWTGMQDANGEEIKFNGMNLNALPGPLIKVLDKHIIDVNGLREDDEKN